MMKREHYNARLDENLKRRIIIDRSNCLLMEV